MEHAINPGLIEMITLPTIGRGLATKCILTHCSFVTTPHLPLLRSLFLTLVLNIFYLQKIAKYLIFPLFTRTQHL